MLLAPQGESPWAGVPAATLSPCECCHSQPSWILHPDPPLSPSTAENHFHRTQIFLPFPPCPLRPPLDLPSLGPKPSVLGSCYCRVTLLSLHVSVSQGSQGRMWGNGSGGFVVPGTQYPLVPSLCPEGQVQRALPQLLVMPRSLQPTEPCLALS